MKAYRLSPQAAGDIETITDHVASASGVPAALHVKRALDKAFGLLAEAPRIGHVRPEFIDRPLLVWPVWSYLIIYDPAADPLEIVRVIHGARDIDEAFD
ncbi:MAG: type II toxin-antitoxin system RelE/ParE family toxin [Phycisphaerales bacterium JB039]